MPIGGGPGGALPGLWVRARSQADAELLEEERRMRGRQRPRHSVRSWLVFAAVVAVVLVAWNLLMPAGGPFS